MPLLESSPQPQSRTQSNPLRIVGVGAAAAPKLEALKEEAPDITPALRQAEISHFPETARIGRRRPKRSVRFAVSILGILAIGTVALAFYLFPRSTPASGTRSIAVLPLKPINAADRDTITEMAIAESLILKLSLFDNLRVRPLTAVRRYVDLDKDPIDAGNELEVDLVLSSNYQLANGKIRVTSQLLNVRTGKTEAPFTSEHVVKDMFSTQDAIANQIGNGVVVHLGGQAGTFTLKRGTNNEEAYRLYGHGMYLTEKYNQTDAARAIEAFDEALRLDPMYAAAWAGKAHAHCNYAHRGGNAPTVEFTNAEPALEKALAIDKNNAEAYAIRGIINRDYHWNFPEAYKSFDRALELDPNLIIAHRWRGQLLMMDGRHDEAIEETKKTIDLNPSWIGDHINYTYVLLHARRYDEAIRQSDRVREMDQSSAAPYDALWNAYHLKGDHFRAYENFLQGKKLAGASDLDIANFENVFRHSGWLAVLRSDRDAMIAKLKNDYSPTKFWIASLSAALGDNEIALKYLNECLDNRLMNLSLIKIHPFLDSLRGDPRFDETVRRAGL
jgi:tetratricopeptide (TPR) repeat protein